MRSTENLKDALLADTYALIEMLEGNPNYKEYSHAPLVTTVFHLAELYYYLMRTHKKEEADRRCKRLATILVPVSVDVVAAAMQYRFSNRKMKLSYAGCIGYALARSQNILFLTGDKQFRDVVGVAFVR